MTAEMQAWTFENTERTHLPAFIEAQGRARFPHGFLTFYGPSGVGKTRLAACVINHAVQNGHPALYVTLAELLEMLRQGYKKNNGADHDHILFLAQTADVLVIDEIDKARLTDWGQDQLFQIIEWRWRESYKRLTVFISNADIKDLPAYWLDRILDSEKSAAFYLPGPSYRSGL